VKTLLPAFFSPLENLSVQFPLICLRPPHFIQVTIMTFLPREDIYFRISNPSLGDGSFYSIHVTTLELRVISRVQQTLPPC